MSGPQPLLGPSGERDVLKGTLFGDHRTTRAPTIAATRTAATTSDRRLTRRLAGRPRDAYVVTGVNYDRRIERGKDRPRLPFGPPSPSLDDARRPRFRWNSPDARRFRGAQRGEESSMCRWLAYSGNPVS